VDQQAADVAIAAFRDAPEAFLSTARSLLWYQAQPSGELSPGFELARISDRRDDRARRDRAYAWNGRQPLADLVCLVPGEQLLLDLLYTGGDIAKLSRENTQHVTSHHWQSSIACPFEELEKALDIAYALTRDDAELGKMSTDGADETAPLADQQLVCGEGEARLVDRRS
jgi:hypothetical protein